MDDRGRQRVSQVIAVTVGVLLILFLRGVFAGDGGGGDGADGLPPNPGNCLQLFVTASSEKAALLTQMADGYNRSGAQVGGRCVQAVVTSKASGGAMDALARGWKADVDGPRPDVWTPAGSSWVGLLQQRTAARDQPDLVPAGDLPHVAYSPLVIAMPRPMAEALGWPGTAIGWNDVYALAQRPQRLGFGRPPRVGRLQARQDQPELLDLGAERARSASTSPRPGLSSDLTLARVEDPKVQDFVRGVESSVVHYGDTTLTFLSNLQRADDRGEGLDVHLGRHDRGEVGLGLQPGQPHRRPGHPRRPRQALDAARRDLPEGGHAVLRPPLRDPQAPWVTTRSAQASHELPGLGAGADAAAGVPAMRVPRLPRATRARVITQGNGLLPAQPKQVLEPAGAAGARPAIQTRAGRSSASARGCCWSSTCRARWATRRAAAPASSSSRRRPRSTPCRCSHPTTTWACGCFTTRNDRWRRLPGADPDRPLGPQPRPVPGGHRVWCPERHAAVHDRATTRWR